MTVKIKLVAYSLAPHGGKIYTFQARYPHIVHPQFMTHREFSRNASSARAIPVEKKIQEVLEDPYIPIYWGRNKKGMQATEELGGLEILDAAQEWLWARDDAVKHARRLVELGLHKEEANRVIETFAHIDVIFTTTSLGNFLNLRDDAHAHRLMQEFAHQVISEVKDATPRELFTDEWHLPYVSAKEIKDHNENWGLLKKLSVARCARVSYNKHDGTPPTTEEDVARHDDLKKNLHMSAFEHQASPAGHIDEKSGNFTGWYQYRKEIVGEYRPSYPGI